MPAPLPRAASPGDFSDTDPNPTDLITVGLNRLAIKNEPKKPSQSKKARRVGAASQKFQEHFGSNLSNLEGLQALCSVVGIADIPPSTTKCKKALRKFHVNIFDLLDAARSHTVVRRFNNASQLADYSFENNKVFPLRVAKQNKLLKFMLRDLS